MASIVLIESNGTVKTLKTKEVTPETLYKKCGFRVNEDFLCRHTWQVKLTGASTASNEVYSISVWAKKSGKANSENKYDFPPPIDKELFFGTCAVVRTELKDTNTFIDLTKETWLKIYEKLFGGFEDIGDEDEYSEDELANVDPALLTKNGYLKDGFVVSDKEDISNEVTPSSSPPAIEPLKKGKKIVRKKSEKAEVPTKQKKTEAKPKVAEKLKVAEKPKPKPAKETCSDESGSEGDTDETTSELEEEVYTFSDDD